MCRCFFSSCPGVIIPGHAPLWCRDNVYVFIKEPCENQASGDCIPTWRPDPRGNHDQCSNCTRTQRYIFPEGVSTSLSKRKVHTPRHSAPNYAPPPYVRPPGYEDSEPRVAPNSIACAESELPLRHTRFNLAVVPSMPTRRPPPSGILGQPIQPSTSNAATRLAEPGLIAANFPIPAPESNSRLTGLRRPMVNTATPSAERRLTAAGYPFQAPATNSRRTGLRLPMANTATQSAGPGPSQGTNLGRTDPRTPTTNDTVGSRTPIPFRDLNSTATSLQPPAANFLSRPPTRRLFARPGSTDRLVPTVAIRTDEASTGQQSHSTSPSLPRVLPVVYTGGTNPHIYPSTVNSQLGFENSPSTLPRPYTQRTAGMFLAPPPRHETRSPPIGVNLAEWDFEEAAPQVNSNPENEGSHELTQVAHREGNYVIAARVELSNSIFVDQSSIAQASQGSANDVGLLMDNQRSSRWRSVREWARRTGQRTSRRANEQMHEQPRRFASPRGSSSPSGGQANEQDPTQRRHSLAESLRAIRRRPFTWRRQIIQSESASHQAQDEFGSSLDPVHIPVAPNDQPRQAVAEDRSPNHEPVVGASESRTSTQLSDRTVSEFLRRTRDHVPDSSGQRSHASNQSVSITTLSILSTGSEWSRDRGHDSGNHPSPSSGSNRSSSSGHASIQEQAGGEELVEIGNAIVRLDTGAQATDWDWNF